MKKIFITIIPFFFCIVNLNSGFTQEIQGKGKTRPNQANYLIIQEASHELQKHSWDEQNLWFLNNQENIDTTKGRLLIIDNLDNIKKNKKQLDHLKTEIHKKNNEIYYDPEQNGYLLFKLNRMQPR